MGAKKKQPSKTEVALVPSREVSSTEIGFTITGSLDIDFPEGMKKHASPPPKVLCVEEGQYDTDEKEEEHENENQKTQEEIFEEQKPKLIATFRTETEGKTVNRFIVGIQVKNWHFRPEDAKVLSQCLERHERVETIQFMRAKISKQTLDNLVLPNSVKFISIHLNNMADGELLDSLFLKGSPHIGLQYNNLGTAECALIAERLRTNDTVITLNLSGNKIGDEGAKLIARSILFNKKLAALSLQNCGLGDVAATELSKVLSRQVMMLDDEIVEWRRVRMELIVASNSQLQLTIQPTKPKRPGSEHSSQTGKDANRKARKATEKNEKGVGAKKRKSNANMNEQKSASPKIPDPTIPDDTGIERIGGKMYTPGNRTLYSLNISNNRIGHSGLLDILEMISNHCENEKQTEVSTTALQHVKVTNNAKIFCFDEDLINYSFLEKVTALFRRLKTQENPRFADVISGIEIPPIITTSTSSMKSNPRLNEIKEEN